MRLGQRRNRPCRWSTSIKSSTWRQCSKTVTTSHNTWVTDIRAPHCSRQTYLDDRLDGFYVKQGWIHAEAKVWQWSCVKWYQEHFRCTQNQWGAVMFTDESWFCLAVRTDMSERVWHRMGKHYSACYVKQDWGYKSFFHAQLSWACSLPINMKISTIVGSFVFISREIFMISHN